MTKKTVSVEPCGEDWITITVGKFDFTITNEEFDDLFANLSSYKHQRLKAKEEEIRNRGGDTLDAYFALVGLWAKEHDMVIPKFTKEELSEIYDDVYFEAMRLQEELD